MGKIGKTRKLSGWSIHADGSDEIIYSDENQQARRLAYPNLGGRGTWKNRQILRPRQSPSVAMSNVAPVVSVS